MTPEQAIIEYPSFFKQKKIDIVMYNLNCNFWWRGRQGIILKTYKNFPGNIIKKGTQVCILFKMQTTQSDYVLHPGLFFVKSIDNIEIGGIEYSDIILK